jgi:hypothetical protein
VALLFFFRSTIATLDASTIVGTWAISFVRPRRRLFSRPDRVRSRPTRADDVQGWPRSGHRRLGLYIGEHDGMLDASGRMNGLLACVSWRGIDGQVRVDVHGSCDDRINLYPAAPFRLATLLNAWMIAREDGAHLSDGRLAVPICDADVQPHIRPAQRARRSVRTVVPCQSSIG